MKGVTHDSCRRVDRATQCINGDDMRCLLVPRAVFLPVARRDLFPRVVEVDCLLEILHCEIVCAVMWIQVMCVVAAMLRVAAIRKSWFDGIGRWAAIAFEWVLSGL